MSQRSLLAVGTLLAALLVGGCATDQRFQTTTPTSHITGERVCEVPQHWKALALEGVDTRSLDRAAVAQIRIPAEWLGDALGWFVETEDRRALQHVPRFVWSALVLNEETGEQQRYPAIMKNPLTTPYLTVVMNGRPVSSGRDAQVYVLSGARTRLLTVGGDRLRLPRSQDCLSEITTEFIREFPSKAAVIDASAGLLASVKRDFSKPSLQSDGLVYSIHPLAVNQRVAGDLRQVTHDERAAERGVSIAFSPVSPLPTLITGAGAVIAYVANEERYAGPFGERSYSAPEAKAALVRMTREYNTRKRELEELLRVPYSGDLSFRLDFEGRKSGWEIGELLALQVEEAWAVLDRLKEQLQSRRNK